MQVNEQASTERFMSEVDDHAIYGVVGRPPCGCSCSCSRLADALVYVDDADGDRVEPLCAWCAVRFDATTADTRSVVNAWNGEQWCLLSRHDWLVNNAQVRGFMAHAYAVAAADILGAERVRPVGAVDDLLRFVGRSNWSMLPERRVAFLIENPDVDPTRPFNVRLYDTGEVHSGQAGPETTTAPVVQLHQRGERTERPGSRTNTG
jgi:hypothetical protein